MSDGEYGGGEGIDTGDLGGEQPSAPDYLLPDYQSPEDQAKAYHQLHGQYRDAGVPLDRLANMGRTAYQWFNSNPQFREIVQKMERGEPLTPAQQAKVDNAQQQNPDLFFDPMKGEEAQREWWSRVTANPKQHFEQIIGHYTGQALTPVQQQMQQLQNELASIKQYQMNVQYGEQLRQLPPAALQLVQQGRLSIPEAIQLFKANGQGNPVPSQPTGNTPRMDRDPTTGRFATTGGKSSPGSKVTKITSPADARAMAEEQVRSGRK